MQVGLPAGFQPSNTDEVVMATWNSKASSWSAARSACSTFSASMKLPKFRARFACSEAIDPESSITNRMSAVPRLDSWMRAEPGWMTHLPTGLKL